MEFEKVRDIIVETLGCDAEAVTPTASLADDLGADSLAAVELDVYKRQAQHQRRYQRRAYGPCHHRQNGKGQPEVAFHRFQYHSPHMDCFFAVIHGCSPLCASNCAA